MSKKSAFKKGFIDAIPIGVLYLCVGFSLGIACSEVKLNALEAFLLSLLSASSTGEFAGVGIMANHGSYFEIILSTFVINLRYLLMSAVLLTKLNPNEKLGRKLLMGTGITDEIFGLSIIQPYPLNPFYVVGCFTISVINWAGGTALGVIMGNVLPDIVVSSLSMAIYAMFVSIVVTPSRKDLVLACVVAISMILSFLCNRFIPEMQMGIRCVVLTVVVSAVASIFFPHTEKEAENE